MKCKCTEKNMHSPPPEGYFCDQHGRAVQLAAVHHCNRHMGHVGRSEGMTLLYHHQTERGWTKKPFFYLLDRTFSAVPLFMLPVVQNYHTGSFSCYWCRV